MTTGRRRFMLQGAGLAAGLGGIGILSSDAFSATPGAQERRAITVETPAGPVRGAVNGETCSFKGIPYALPPVGAMRFRAPQPHPVFRTPWNAFAFGPAPMQPDRIQPKSGLRFIGEAAQSEDCLYLNIWAPATPGPHPVFVWIYGGSNIYGATSQPIYDGTQFASDGVVCVTIGYRVGAFGFLELGDVLGEGYRGSGNNALRDQVLALQWVQKNIHAFGGDARRVTVGGESAGAKNVSALLSLPDARGLFQQAIVQSGGAMTTHDLAEAQLVAREFVAQLQKTEGVGASRALLLESAPERLIKAQIATTAAYPRNFVFRPVIDGTYLANSPQEILNQGGSRHLRLLMGSNRDEALIFFRPELLAAYRKGEHGTAPIASREMAQLDVATISQVEQRYRQVFPEQHDFLRRIQLLSAEEYWVPMLRLAEAHVRNGGEGYMYRFDQESEEEPFRGFAVHASDLPVVWRNFREPFLAMLYRETPTLLDFSRKVHQAWVSFIRDGDPARHTSFAWPRYRLDDRPTMLLSSRGNVIALDPAGDQRRLWEGIL